jgi:hypothetical protein
MAMYALHYQQFSGLAPFFAKFRGRWNRQEIMIDLC